MIHDLLVIFSSLAVGVVSLMTLFIIWFTPTKRGWWKPPGERPYPDSLHERVQAWRRKRPPHPEG
jgi:hypothetical protein